MSEARFTAMGTSCHVIANGGPDDLVEILQERIVELDRLWSRFLPDSDVSRINAGGGEFVVVSFETATLVRRSVQAWIQTGGRFDPTMLGALVRAGYDRDFAAVRAAPTDGHSSLGPGCGGIAIRGREVRVPAGTGFDSGGMGKGLAADLVALGALRRGALGVCVNVGGDTRVAGAGPEAGTWTIAVEHPGSAGPLARLGLVSGAVTTSTSLLRRWTIDGNVRHHLIDPATGRPATGPVELATVVAAEGWRAEALTKAVVLGDASDPLAALGGTGAEGLAVTSDGRVLATPGFASFLGGVPLAERIGPSPTGF